MISHAVSVLATTDSARGGPVTPTWTGPGRATTTGGSPAVMRFPEGNG